MTLLHYTKKIGEGEYIVITEERPTGVIVDGFCRSGYELTGKHDLEASNNMLPTERELEPC